MTTLAPEVQKRQRIEKAVINALLITAIQQGYTVSVDNGEYISTKRSTDRKVILADLMACDEESLILHKDNKRARVFLVYGNDGWDVIVDYSLSIEHLMESAERVSDAIQNKLYP